MPVAKAMLEKLEGKITELKEKEIFPKLAIVRVGEREDDLSYERGVYKRFQSVGALVETRALQETVSQIELEECIRQLNEDKSVHGVLLFRPLPKHLDENRIKGILKEEKDIDCLTSANDAHLFASDGLGYTPCTPQAVMEILEYYNIPLAGKRVTIIGRSMVVGRPMAMLMISQNATVTICHSKTRDLKEDCKKADILVAAAGVPRLVTEEFVSRGQIIIDVGIHMVEGKLCGDVDYEAIAELADSITPVPGGVGSVTTTVLLKHTVMSAAGCSRLA